MKTWKAMAAVLAMAALGSGTGDAHELEFLNATGDAWVLCERDLLVSVGGVCIEAGHLGEQEALLRLRASETAPTSGLYCQDVNGNGMCGESSTDEPSSPFCGTLFLRAGDDWSPDVDVVVYADLVLGLMIWTPCGTVYSGSLFGAVDHG